VKLFGEIRVKNFHELSIKSSCNVATLHSYDMVFDAFTGNHQPISLANSSKIAFYLLPCKAILLPVLHSHHLKGRKKVLTSLRPIYILIRTSAVAFLTSANFNLRIYTLDFRIRRLNFLDTIE